jgi:hypothetical protein
MPELGVPKRSRLIIVGCGEDRFLFLEALRKIKDRYRRYRVLSTELVTVMKPCFQHWIRQQHDPSQWCSLCT